MTRYLMPPEKPALAPTGSAASPLRLGFSDAGAAARQALDRPKLLVAFVGLCLTALVFFLFASIGNVTGSAVWRAGLRYVGDAAAYLVLAMTCFVLSRLVQFELRTGGVRTGSWETLRHCLRRLWALCFTPGVVAVAALVAVGLMALIAGMGRLVPTVYTFLFLVEFALGLAVVAAGVVLTWGLFLYPAIVAGEQTDEFDTVRTYLAMHRKDGLALAFYELASVAVTWVLAVVPSLVAMLALGSVRGVSSAPMGPALARCAARVPQVLGEIVRTWLAGVGQSLAGLWGGAAGFAEGLGAALTQPTGLTHGEQGGFLYGMSGAFLGVSLAVIVAATLSYALVFFVTAGARVYQAYAPPAPNPAAEQRAAA
jgi:hypothetical protein